MDYIGNNSSEINLMVSNYMTNLKVSITELIKIYISKPFYSRHLYTHNEPFPISNILSICDIKSIFKEFVKALYEYEYNNIKTFSIVCGNNDIIEGENCKKILSPNKFLVIVNFECDKPVFVIKNVYITELHNILDNKMIKHYHILYDYYLKNKKFESDTLSIEILYDVWNFIPLMIFKHIYTSVLNKKLIAKIHCTMESVKNMIYLSRTDRHICIQLDMKKYII